MQKLISMKNTLAATMVALFIGCAAAPEDIAPAMVDTTQYQNLNCESLLLAKEYEEAILDEVSEDQQTSRNWDMLLNMIVLGAGVLTGDSEYEVAETKGRIIAIQNEYGTRCR